MLYLRTSLFLAFILMMLSPQADSQSNLPAFPGAEGFGKFTTGGRGGRVIYVTNLNDDANQGSLRFAISQTGPRTILFTVSGTISLKSSLTIKNGDVTIAGQTAPGDGICLRDYPVVIDADNVIIRFLRFRMGDETKQENDALWGREQKNIIIDHCSMSWSTDECSSFYDNENFTMQWCILSESLRNSVHGKGTHGYGGIWGGHKASFHHNLLAVHDSRNPRFCGSRYSNNPGGEIVDFRNNVIYNWGSNNSYGAEGGSFNLINNYYKPGPATGSSKSRILQPYADDGSNAQPAGIYGRFFLAGNFLEGNPAVSADNWLGVSLHSSFSSYAPGVTKNDLRLNTELTGTDIPTHSAVNAFQKIVEFGGASLRRDSVDRRIINDVKNGTATIKTGGNGSSNGLIDTQGAVGGWPSLFSQPAPADSDNDGMPDVWEEANNLDKLNPADALMTSVDGHYPNLEVYLAGIIEMITASQMKDAILTYGAHSPSLREKSPRVALNRQTGVLTISHTNRILKVEICSISGTVVHSAVLRSDRFEMDASALKYGLYVIRTTDEKGKISTEKLLTGKTR